MLSTCRTDALRPVSPARTLLLALLCLVAGQAFGGAPHLVVDINPHTGSVSSNPTGLGKLDDIALIAAQKPVFGTTTVLIRADGTPGGTSIIHEFNGTGPVTTAHTTPALMQSGSRAYFAAHENATGNELWVTDGTAAGTHMVKEITPGTSGDPPRLLTPFQGGIAFTVHDAAFAHQLYVTDGTASGTRLLTNFTGSNTGPATDIAVVANGKLYFIVQASISPCCTNELWVSDGTPAGTHVLPGLSTFGSNVNPRSLIALGNRLLFVGDTQSNGSELIALDTTTETFSMIEISPGIDSGAVSRLTFFNGYAYFVGRVSSGDEELWRTDGTPAGTVPVTNVNPGPQSGLVYPYVIQALDNRLIFVGNDGVNNAQLWSTDGTPGSQTVLSSVPFQAGWNVISQTDQYVYLSAGNIFGSGRTTFVTDGTLAGTVALPQVANADPANLAAAVGDATSDYLYYSSLLNTPSVYSVFRYTPGGSSVVTPVKVDTRYNGSFAKMTLLVANGKVLYNFDSETSGNELWVGDASGTRELFNISPEVNTDSSAPGWLADWDGKAVFTADDGVHGRELWISDGTAAGTSLLMDLVPGFATSDPRNLVVWKGALYFFAYDSNGIYRLMRMATPGATPEALAVLNPLPLGYQGALSPPYCYSGTSAVLGDKLYFSAAGDTGIHSLWATDGTIAGTTRVSASIPGAFGNASPCDFTVVGNRLFFTASFTIGGNQLWVSDGTSSGTRLVKSISPGPNNSPVRNLAAVGNQLLFQASDSASGIQTWISDGTAAGTRPLLESAGFAAFPYRSFNGKTFLLSSEPSAGQGQYAIWITDGTAAGTLRVPGVIVDGNSPPAVGAAGLYFINSADGDLEPWVTDGTAAGTRRVADLNSSGNSNTTFLGNFRGIVLMASNDSNGSRIWRTDGTPAGTRLLGTGPAAITQPGAANMPIVAGQNLFYVGMETVPGAELYVVSNDQPTAVADSADISGGQASINVLSNDADPDGSLAPSSVRVVQTPAHGTASVAQNGTISYTPTAGYSGNDTFTYTVSDEQGYASNPATVTLSVTAAPGNGGGANSGGGGALDWLAALVLSLVAGARLAPGLAMQRRREPDNQSD